MNRFLPTILLIACTLLHQGSLAQLRLGAKAGVNASSIHLSAATFDHLPGYQAGIMADVPLNAHFSIQPAVLVNAKGFVAELEIRDPTGQKQESARGIFRLIYTEIPVLLLYKGALGKAWGWYGGLGPYAGIGLTGKSRWDSRLVANSSVKFTSRKQSTIPGNVYKRMDYGLNATLGVEVGKMQFGINHSYGLTPMHARDREPNIAKIYNRTTALTAGYWFGK